MKDHSSSLVTDVIFYVGKQKLFGTLSRTEHEQASVLLVAGGGNKPRKDRYYHLHKDLFLARGITVFDFEFRGIGESAGKMEETSLATRFEDAKAALDTLRKYVHTSEIYVIGTSMGGPVAIQLAKDSFVKGLLLVNPAAYSLEARNKNFGPDFSEAIRKPESWKYSPDFTDLKESSGRMFLMYGTADEVVPAEIFREYSNIIRSKDGTIVPLEGTTHNSWKDQVGLAWSELIGFIAK